MPTAENVNALTRMDILAFFQILKTEIIDFFLGLFICKGNPNQQKIAQNLLKTKIGHLQFLQR